MRTLERLEPLISVAGLSKVAELVHHDAERNPCQSFDTIFPGSPRLSRTCTLGNGPLVAKMTFSSLTSLCATLSSSWRYSRALRS